VFLLPNNALCSKHTQRHLMDIYAPNWIWETPERKDMERSREQAGKKREKSREYSRSEDKLKSKVKKSRALNETPSQNYGVSFAIWDQTVLPAT